MKIAVVLGSVVGCLFLYVATSGVSAPARAVYYTDQTSLVKMNPDGSGKTALFPQGIPQGWY